MRNLHFGFVPILCGIAWLMFSVWTVRRLWRPVTSKYSRIVYFCGVKALGVGGSVLAPMAIALQDWGSKDAELPRFMFLIAACVGPPLWLWAGYVSGRMLAFLLGLSRDSKDRSRRLAP
jgi:hypothetical protein